MSNTHARQPLRPALAETRTAVRVLLIEDDASYADLVKILLSANPEQECEVSVASTLKEGLQALEKRKDFDAVLLDLSLPDSDGLDTLLAVLRGFPTISVIVLTGSNDQEQGIQAVGAGAQDYLVKGGFEPNQLARVLRFSMERKQILMRLEEAQRIAKIGNWEFRPADNYFFASPQIYELLGLSSTSNNFTYQDLQGKNCSLHFLLQQEDYPLEDELTQNLELSLPDDRTLYVQLNSRRVIQADGTANYIGTLQDTTLQRRAEELQHAQELAEETARVREQVIATVSHELRTPMNAIVGMSHLLADTQMSEEQQQYVGAVQDASQLLLGIVNDILLTSSLQNNAIQLEEEPFDLSISARGILEMLRPKAEAKGLKLLFYIQPCLKGRLIGDKQRISQVLYNILGNAIKFTEKGEVELAINCEEGDEGETLFLKIRDTGPGIPPEKHADIFLAFSRLPQVGNKQEGTGLGLSIAKELVSRMGGRIELQSEEGKGALFTVLLPLKVASATAAPQRQQSKPTVATDDSPIERLLLVEDHTMNQIVLKKTLHNKWPTVEVQIAGTAAEAHHLLETKLFDLILMDIQLPDSDGFTLTKELRTKPDGLNAHTPVVAMTAQAQIAADERYVQVGMNDYVLKPFNPKELFRKITQHSSNKHTKHDD